MAGGGSSGRRRISGRDTDAGARCARCCPSGRLQHKRKPRAAPPRPPGGHRCSPRVPHPPLVTRDRSAPSCTASRPHILPLLAPSQPPSSETRSHSRRRSSSRPACAAGRINVNHNYAPQADASSPVAGLTPPPPSPPGARAPISSGPDLTPRSAQGTACPGTRRCRPSAATSSASARAEANEPRDPADCGRREGVVSVDGLATPEALGPPPPPASGLALGPLPVAAAAAAFFTAAALAGCCCWPVK